MRFSSALRLIAPLVVALLATGLARGQNSTVTLQVGPADSVAGSLAFRAMGLAGSKTPAPSSGVEDGSDSIPGIEKPGFYPADVSNPGHNPAVITTEHHPIYVNAPPSHWGDVPGFLTDLGKSEFIHLLDQYVGSTANNRYTLGTQLLVPNYPIPANHTLLVPDILALVHAGGAIKGNGLGHLYHVFLPKGVDMCLSPTECYSPDKPATFVFCGFHGAVTFSDKVGHVIFSVEPYQDVNGCSVPPTGTANSQLIDSTDTVLSHEVFEALSDPDLNAWWVQSFTFAFGNEIGDLCTRARQIGANFYWNYGNVQLNDHKYTIQPEYSNTFHGCAYGPAEGPDQ